MAIVDRLRQTSRVEQKNIPRSEVNPEAIKLIREAAMREAQKFMSDANVQEELRLDYWRQKLLEDYFAISRVSRMEDANTQAAIERIKHEASGHARGLRDESQRTAALVIESLRNNRQGIFKPFRDPRGLIPEAGFELVTWNGGLDDLRNAANMLEVNYDIWKNDDRNPKPPLAEAMKKPLSMVHLRTP